MPEIIPEQKAS